jgi:LmbE family N-acetylglucosaminyl deacetylase
MKVDILAFGAHPDDVELGCGATIARSVFEGKSVGIIDLTQGEMGTNGSPETRNKEATKAASILGVKFRDNLKFKDIYFTDLINFI